MTKLELILQMVDEGYIDDLRPTKYTYDDTYRLDCCAPDGTWCKKCPHKDDGCVTVFNSPTSDYELRPLLEQYPELFI